MNNNNFVENIASPLQHSASVKNVFGEPITAQGKTIIPVAQVAFGFGGGFGQKNKPAANTNESSKGEEGAGGGGGMYARAKGVYEITDTGTRFIPVNNTAQILLAALAGFLVRGWLFRRK
jgi:uncharacterized spore protein YtfJ